MWEHLWMKPEDDPEARIRELERPLAETARASEMGSNPTPGAYPYQPGTPTPPPMPPVNYGTNYGPTIPTLPSRKRLLWVLLPFFVIGLVSFISYNTQRHSQGGMVILSPTPSTASSAAPAPSPSEAQPPAPAPSASPSAALTAPAGADLTISGIKESRTIACNQSAINLSGISNKVVITGHCTSLHVSGVQNSITVDTVDSIDVSGFNNQITYHTGSPSIDKSGDGNVVQQG